MSAVSAAPSAGTRLASLAWALRQRVIVALVLLIAFGAVRYDHFLGAYNVLSVLRYTLLANGVPDAAALVVKGAIIAGAVWSQQRGKSA